jgi:hypothetical protein
MTIAEFKRYIAQHFPGASLRDTGCEIACEAPPGHTWDGDLHEYIAAYRRDLLMPRDRGQIAEAIADMRGRLEFAGAPRPCTAQDCEWCRPEE